MTERKDNIDIGQVSETSVPEPKNSSVMAEREARMFAHEHDMRKRNLGWVGYIWGSKAEKPGNIAAIVLIFLLCFVGYLLVTSNARDARFSETLSLLMSAITLILGYLFGSSSKD